MRIGSRVSDLGKYNENTVIHALRRLGPASQRDIAEATSLSIQTVSIIVKNLTGRGYLSEVRTVSPGRGRPYAIVDLVASARHAVGLHIDPTVMTAVVLDLRGQIVDSVTSDSIEPEDPHVTLGAGADLVKRLVKDSRVQESLVGACLAVPGPLDSHGAMVDSVWLPAWSGLRLSPVMGDLLDMHVPVVKDTLAAVIGEGWVRARETLDSTLVFVYVGTGTGVGLALGGEPIRGYSGNAGEVGHMLLALASRGQDATGLDNDPVVMVQAARQQGLFRDSSPRREDMVGIERQFRELCEMGERGDARAAKLLEGAAGRIAQMVVMTTELLDADRVVFGGPYWELVEPWYRPAVEQALAAPSARGPHPVQVLSTAMGTHVGAIGAASVVLDDRYVPRSPRSGARRL